MKFYFAYGSNMDETQMQERCPDARLLGVGALRGYRLAFTIFAPHRGCGAADIMRDSDGSVYGLVYELSDEDATALDHFEGVPQAYRHVPVTIDINGKKLEADTYEVVEKVPGLQPSKEYLNLLKGAAARREFPEEYRRMLDAIITQ